MQKIFVFVKDAAFLKRIRRILPQTILLLQQSEYFQKDQIRKALKADPDLIIMDSKYISHLMDLQPKAKIMVASDTYDKDTEYLSARLGAKGFITKDMKTPQLKRAFNIVNSGQVWMTRAVAARICSEYRNIFRGNQNIVEV
ncbi:MAG: hypothetical protein L6290_13210 [Thermodesulfovibrionales bacterium]|nr:hypothetical protein [Thermodesulfovibrionales bacterium]